MQTTIQQTYSINSMNEIADIESHIEFLRLLSNKYNWDINMRNKILSDLSFIEHKKNDKTLHLSIIGEFSSGKSSFINALLRDNLLEAGIIQGTTVSATTIEYAPEYSVTVISKNGQKQVFDNSNAVNTSKNTVREYIKELTTNEKIASNVKEVIIGHPSKALENGISIIDTPGTNSLERWHEDVTKMAIREISDVSIILTSAEYPMPETLINFVDQNLAEVMGQCIFVATKMDLVKAKERESQLDYIRQKITNTFGIENPLVLPYTPKLVLGEFDREIKEDINYTGSDYQTLLEQAYQTEEEINKKLLERRIILQCSRLLGLINETFTTLQNSLNTKINENKQKYQEIENAKIKDIDLYINNSLKNLENNYNFRSHSINSSVLAALQQSLGNFKNGLLSVFDRLLTREPVTNFVRTLPDMLKKHTEAQLPEIFSDMSKHLYSIGNELNKKMFDDFKHQYTRLAITGDHSPLASVSLISEFTLKNDITYKADFRKALENAKILVNINRYIPLIEGITGIFDIFRFNSIKADYRSKIVTLLNEYINAVQNLFSRTYTESNEAILFTLKESVLSFKNEYKGLINKVNEQDRSRQKELTTYRSEIEQSLQELAVRHKKVESIQERILQYQY